MPLPGYDLTLLLTHRHLERYSREGLVDFICQVGRGVGRGVAVQAERVCAEKMNTTSCWRACRAEQVQFFKLFA